VLDSDADDVNGNSRELANVRDVEVSVAATAEDVVVVVTIGAEGN
jgi:hypothetical protein